MYSDFRKIYFAASGITVKALPYVAIDKANLTALIILTKEVLEKHQIDGATSFTLHNRLGDLVRSMLE